MGLENILHSIGDEWAKRTSRGPEHSLPNTEEQLGAILDSVMTRFPENHRIGTYAQSLYRLSPQSLSGVRRILEVGMNDTLLRFRNIFPRDIELFGMTLDQEHAKAAREAARKQGVRANVVVRDIQTGLPPNWKDIDLAMDIFSASHYADTSATMRTLAASLRQGGHMIIVPGAMMMAGMADYVRNRPIEEQSSPQAAFRYIQKDRLVTVNTGYGTSLTDAVKRTVADLQRNGYDLPDDPSEEELIVCLDDMCVQVEHDIVTNIDLMDVRFHKVLRQMGMIDITRFSTNDGEGWLAKKE